MPKTIIYSCAAMLFIGALPMPYGYYTLLRLVASGIFAFAAYIAFERKSILLPWLFGFTALIFNPFIKVHLAKELWMFIDVVAGLFLVISAKHVQYSDKKRCNT